MGLEKNKYRISGQLLRLRRSELQLTQHDVSDKISIGRSQYANIESGNTNPSITVLIELTKLFDISFEELYGLKNSKRLIAIKKARIAELKKELHDLENITH